ncbi:MAG TPA: MFS transporter, partial [Acidimicrobiales bacterium]
GRRTMLRAALFVLPVLLILYALAPSLWLSAVAFLAVGAGYIAVLAGLNTVVQLRAPAEARGRVLSIYMMVLGIVYPIGAVVQGSIANHTGVRAVTVAGAVVLMVAMVSIAALRPVVIFSLGDPATPGPSPSLVPTDELP